MKKTLKYVLIIFFIMIIIFSYRPKENIKDDSRIDYLNGLIISGAEVLPIKEELSNNKHSIYVRDKISEKELYILSVVESPGKQEIIIDKFKSEK